MDAVLQLRRGAGRAGPQRLALLAAVRDHGSITAAARAAGLSYKGAWDAVQVLNGLFAAPLIEAKAGGRQGGSAALTQAGETVVAVYRSVEQELSQLVARLDDLLATGGGEIDRLWRLGMRTSARNSLRGKVVAVRPGAVNAEVLLDIGVAEPLVAIVTSDSVADLGLAEGVEALALVKSSFVILVPGDEPVRTSARNRLAGTVIAHEAGAVNDEVVLDIGGARTITAIVTRASGEALGFAVGDRAQALVKASHVILAVD